MLRAASAVWRPAGPRLCVSTSCFSQVRHASSTRAMDGFLQDVLPEASLDSADEEEVNPTSDPAHAQALLKKLHAMKFPKIDKTKLQDAEFLRVADMAIDIIREVEDTRQDNPRWFVASDFEGSTELSPHNYTIPKGLADTDGMGEDVDESELDDEMEEEGEDLPSRFERETEMKREEQMNKTLPDLYDEGNLPDENPDEVLSEEEVQALMRKERGDEDVEESEEGSEEDEAGARDDEESEWEEEEVLPGGIKRGSEKYMAAMIRRWRGDDDNSGNYLNKTDNTEAEFWEKIQEFQSNALKDMGDNAFMNNEPQEKTGLDSLKDWFNEFKFVQEGGRYSLAKQTQMFAKYKRDYEAKMNDKEDTNVYDLRNGFIFNEVIKVGRHCKVTKGGRVFSYSTLILVGTGKGTAGFGYGKGPSAAEAADRAYKDAERNLVSIPLYRGGIANGFEFRKRGSFMKCWTYSPGPNRNINDAAAVSHPVMHNLMLAFGINNGQLRSWKRRNWHNMLEGFFHTIPRAVSHPEDTARKMGLRLKVLAHEERFDNLKPHYQ